jgi:hypothetical protein
MHKAIVSIFFTILAATASASGVEMPFVSAEGRLTGAYQDTVDAAFVCLVLERHGNFQYAFIKTNDTASVLKDLQPLVGRNVSVSGSEKIPEAFNRAVTRRQIMIPSLDDVRAASGGNSDMFAKMIRSCRTDLRRCLWDLRSDVLDEPDFDEAIRKTLAPVAAQHPLQCVSQGLAPP